MNFKNIISDFKKAKVSNGRPKKKKPLCYIIKTRIDEEDKLSIENLLKQKNISESELLRIAVKEYLDKNEKSPYRKRHNEPY